jgi:hypothetical protein
MADKLNGSTSSVAMGLDDTQGHHTYRNQSPFHFLVTTSTNLACLGNRFDKAYYWSDLEETGSGPETKAYSQDRVFRTGHWTFRFHNRRSDGPLNSRNCAMELDHQFEMYCGRAPCWLLLVACSRSGFAQFELNRWHRKVQVNKITETRHTTRADSARNLKHQL